MDTNDLNNDFLVGLDIAPTFPSKWSPKLVFDLALGLDGYDTLYERYDLNKETLDYLFEQPIFRKEVATLTRELREKNTIFRAKAKTQAEMYLEDIHTLMGDADTPASTKLSIFQTLTKLGELEPELKKPAPATNPLLNPGQAVRMVVEWVGGPKDMSPVSNQELISHD